MEGVVQEQLGRWVVGWGKGKWAFIWKGWTGFGNTVKRAMRRCILLTARPCLQDQSLSGPPTTMSH